MSNVRGFMVLCCLGFLAMVPGVVVSQAADVDRTAWYREARCGLFIHWGLYAVPGGVYQSKRIDTGFAGGLGELLMENLKIPVAEYAKFAPQFNPVKFDADAWVRIAKDAGMKYIVFTAKHCEGFAMFKTAASSFNIVDATLFGRDPLRELAEACRKHDMRLGFYYSQAMDWRHPGGGARGDGHWDPAQDGDFDAYLQRIAIPQVRELLTNYGPVSVLWWDVPTGMTPNRAARFAELLKLQPTIVTNNRLLNHRTRNDYSGDFDTPEQQIPTWADKDRMFEVCMTMNGTWGYKRHDHNWKSASDIIRKLIDIAGKGGNLLLNVGPNELGEFPAPSVDRLRVLGAWLRTNGASIYGTSASLFHRLPWGRSTTKGNTVYLHVFDWPEDGRLIVPGVRSPVHRASLLATHASLTVRAEGESLVVSLPPSPPDTVCSVISLEFTGTPRIEPVLPEPGPDGAIELPAALAAIVNAYGANARLLGSGASRHIGDWDRVNTALNWEFRVRQPGEYVIQIEAAVSSRVSVGVACGVTALTGVLDATAGTQDYRTAELGKIVISSAGHAILELTSQGKDWRPVQVRAVRLIPVR